MHQKLRGYVYESDWIAYAKRPNWVLSYAQKEDTKVLQ